MKFCMLKESSGGYQIRDTKRMLVGGPESRRRPSIQIDDRVMGQGLDEDCRTGGFQSPRNLWQRSIEIEMVEDPRAADQIE